MDLTRSVADAGAIVARLNPRSRQVLRWWSGAVEARTQNGQLQLPARHEVDPAAFPTALASVCLADWLAEERTARFRLSGDEIDRLFDRSLVGLRLEDIAGPGRESRLLGIYRTVAETPCVHVAEGRIYQLSRDLEGLGQRLILPLAEDGREITHLISVTSYELHGSPAAKVHPFDASGAPGVRESYVALEPMAEAGGRAAG
jgi:hypothetical protein